MTRQDDRIGVPTGHIGDRLSFLGTPAGIALCAVLAVAGVLLWIDHRIHVLAVLPLLLPLAGCLAMHFLKHRRHGGRHADGDRHEH